MLERNDWYGIYPGGYHINVEGGEINLYGTPDGDEIKLELMLFDTPRPKDPSAFFSTMIDPRFICTLENAHLLAKYRYIEKKPGLPNSMIRGLESLFLCIEDTIKGIPITG
ncbi:MAG TPA: hypothetical protein VJH20_01025 [Candidatus Nanoarchaeia archaeon]|nr:hypothetical protein [Candidatus Nanoarchaeia archaeon]